MPSIHPSALRPQRPLHPLAAGPLRALARSLLIGAGLALASACHDPAGVSPGDPLRVEVRGLAPLDPAEGAYELWVRGDDDVPISLGRVGPEAAFDPLVVEFLVPETGARRVDLTLEPPGDADDRPSRYRILSGELDGARADLSIEGSITDGRPFVVEPGHHSLFTSSNNVAEGYPSAENAGLWLFSIYVSINPHGRREVHLIPLDPAWLYEGWIVHRPGTADEVWISYGKYRPDLYGFLTSRDNTGSGPFSGDEDFRNGGVEDVPGDEWTSNLFGLQLPGGLELPLALDAVDPVTGEAEWYHVITVEPAFDEAEPLTEERPFVLRPYRNPIGEGRASDPRRIVYQDNDPTGTVAPVR